jgi:RimJ/RimL family protein N-acetyltransferase
LTPRELTFLTDIDHIHHEAFAAVDQRDASIVGIGPYVHIADRPKVAELGIEVADELQRMGIGTALARLTAQRARANGFALLTATTLWENRPGRAVATPRVPRSREPRQRNRAGARARSAER